MTTTQSVRTAAVKSAETADLQAQINALKEELKIMKLYVERADKAIEVFRKMGAVYGEYKGSDGRLVPAVITAAWPRAGTVDIVVFDNLYSGGKNELTGIFLGTDRSEMNPYFLPELDEDDESDDKLAAER